jgi:hypothetical protein
MRVQVTLPTAPSRRRRLAEPPRSTFRLEPPTGPPDSKHWAKGVALATVCFCRIFGRPYFFVGVARTPVDRTFVRLDKLLQYLSATP